MADSINLNGGVIESWAHMPVAADQAIDVGDLVSWVVGSETIAKISAFTWATSDAATRRASKRFFAGVAADAHRSGDPKGLIKVITVGEMDATVDSGTFDLGALVGIDGDGAAALKNQHLLGVTDPAEAIGSAYRRYSANVTTARVRLKATITGLLANTQENAMVLTLGTFNPAAVADLITDVPAHQIFGGAAEIIAITTINNVALADGIVINIEKNATNLAAHTVATVTAGFTVSTDLSADAARKFDAADLFSIEVSDAAATGSIAILVKYRRLS